MLNNEEGFNPLSKAELMDKQAVGMTIESYVTTDGLSYLEATSRWMEEQCIPENQFAKYIPGPILDKIKAEVVEDGTLRPSLAAANKPASLSFMYD